MKCPYCYHPKSRVQETRALANTIWRVRRCDGCDKTFTTQESRAERLPQGIHKLAAGRGTRAAKRLFKATDHLDGVFHRVPKESDK